MILLAVDWHPWFSYAWWRDIGAGLLSVTAALVIGASTVTVAVRSHLFAKSVREREANRSAEDARERYEVRLVAAIGTVVSDALVYLRLIADKRSHPIERAAQEMAVHARLRVAHSVAQGEDRVVTRQAMAVFATATENYDEGIQASVIGEITGALTALIRRDPDNITIAKQLALAVKRATETNS